MVFVANVGHNDEDKMTLFKARRKDADWEFFDYSEIVQKFFMKDDYIIVPVDSMDAAGIVDKMESYGKIIKDIATVNFGMQLRDRKKYPADVTNDESLVTNMHKPCYTGKNILEYRVNYDGLYCYFDREAKKGGCWDEEAQLANPKLLCRQIGKYPIVGIDLNGYPVLNTAFMISQFKEKFSPYTLMGILNSKVVKFYWKQRFSDNRKQFPKIKGTYLEMIPIARNDNIELTVENLVKEIMSIRDDVEIREKIDEQVCLLYGLTETEIEVVKNTNYE